MQTDTQFTKEPVKGSVKPLAGGKKVVDKKSGKLMCFLRMDKLYDLNHVCFASCKRVRSDKVKEVGAFATDGRYLYDNGVAVGRIQRSNSVLVIILLLLLLAVSATSLSVFIYEKNKPIIPDFTVVDADGAWGATGKLNVFGKEKISPGDKGTYMFMINNPHAADLNCKIRFTLNYENNELLPPIKYSAYSEGRLLNRTETDNEGFEVSGLIIKKKNARAIILEWEWEFDGDDEKDTIIGVLGEKYYINIEIIAEEA